MKKEGSRSGPRLSRFSEGRGGKKEWRKHNILYFVSRKPIVSFLIDRLFPITRVFHTDLYARNCSSSREAREDG